MQGVVSVRQRRRAGLLLACALTLTACGQSSQPATPGDDGANSTSGTDPSATTSASDSSATSTQPADPSTGATDPGSTTTSSPPEADYTAPSTLRVGIATDNPGVGLRTPSNIIGFDADVARYVAQALGADDVSFVQALPNQRETLLATGQVDMIVSSYSMNPGRARGVTFAGPYLQTGQDLLLSSRSSIRDPEQLRGFTACSASGSTSTAELIEDYPGLHLIEEDTVAACVDLLRRGEVKAVTSDQAILLGFAQSSREPNALVVAGHAFTEESWGIGLPRGERAMCREVSEALREMVDSGEWERILAKNLPSLESVSGEEAPEPEVDTCRRPRSESAAEGPATPGSGSPTGNGWPSAPTSSPSSIR